MKNIIAAFTDRRIAITLLLGFSSGLPLALSGSALQAWFSVSHVSLTEIGFIGLAGLPYTFKFLWAPMMDRWVPPFLGRRRGWILICQLLLCAFIAGMTLFTPDAHPKVLFFLACLVAFFSASQDIVVDAYRTDVLDPEQRPMGAAMAINGYRIAMLVSSGLALIIAHHWGWKVSYLLMAGLMGISAIATVFGPDPKVVVTPPKKLWDCTVLPFLDFLKRPQAVWILFFIVFYKLGDAFAGALSQTFLIREIHFNLAEIGVMHKSMGFLGTIFGTLSGALLIARFGWFRGLLTFGVLQAISNLIYMILMWTGPDYFIAAFSILLENYCGGMGAAAFTGLIMALCNSKFSAFQYALLSSLSAIGRVFIGPLAGFIANDYGWTAYFMSSVVLAIPGLVLLFLLKNNIQEMTETQAKSRASESVDSSEAASPAATTVPSTS